MPVHRVSFQAMASSCEVVLNADSAADAQHLADQAMQEVWRIEQRYSRYRSDSIVARINAVSRRSNASGTPKGDTIALSGDVVIDTRSVNTGFADFNGHIQGEDFLDTAKFPTATFKSTRVLFEGNTPKSIEGVLTLKGISKPVTLAVTSFQAMPHPMLKKPALGANATTTIKRSEFNAGKYAPYVGDEVRIDIAIEAIAP